MKNAKTQNKKDNLEENLCETKNDYKKLMILLKNAYSENKFQANTFFNTTVKNDFKEKEKKEKYDKEISFGGSLSSGFKDLANTNLNENIEAVTDVKELVTYSQIITLLFKQHNLINVSYFRKFWGSSYLLFIYFCFIVGVMR